MMSTLLKFGLSGYDVKQRFVRSDANISKKIHFFIDEKINPPSIISGGGCMVSPAGS